MEFNMPVLLVLELGGRIALRHLPALSATFSVIRFR